VLLKPVLLGLLAGLGVFALAIATKAPRDDRDWQPHLSVTPAADELDSVWTVGPVRDWRYRPDGPASRDWTAPVKINPASVRRVWLLVEPHPGLPAMAHTLVLLEDDSGQLVGLTIEARKETHEKFAPMRGALRRFELIYVWASPRDLLTRRAVMLDRELELYPLDLTRDQAAAFVLSVLQRTAALAEKPRFYNTLHSNCTNELAKAAGLSWDPAFILTGGAARALHRRGLIAGDTFDAARARARIGPWVRQNAHLGHSAFNASLIELLSANTVAKISKEMDSG